MANTDNLLMYAMFAETLLALSTLGLMAQKKFLKRFYFVAIYLAVFTAENAVTIAMLFYRKEIGISKLLDYNIIFYTRWVCFFVLSTLVLLIIYGVFDHAMKPMKGLHRAGKLIFRWVFAVSAVVSLGIAISPQAGSATYIANLAGHLYQAASILTLCLLAFVCLSIRHLGLTYRSHIFGISLGLGIMATVSLVESAFCAVAESHSLYSPVYIYSSIGMCVALTVWTTYFALPEPAPSMVLLPTTSPYFFWNSISESLGDDPGVVAIAGFKPSMLAEPEMAVILAQGAAEARSQRSKAATEAQAFAAVAVDTPLEVHSVQPVYAMQS
jgi:hypothetical protein